MIFFEVISKVFALCSPLQLSTMSILQRPPPSVPPHHYDTIVQQDPWTLFSQPRVALPQENPTKSFWTHGSTNANPLAKEGSEGPLTTDADIVIIGSGITGVGAAYHLSTHPATADLSLNIIILEARDFCSGATGRNGGHLTPAVFKGFRSIADIYNTTEALRWLALERHTADSLVSLLNSSRHEVDLIHGGHLDLFFSDAQESKYKADWEAARNAGADVQQVQFLSREETHQVYGPAFPSVRFSGHSLWPLKAVTQLFRLAQRNIAKLNTGVELHIHTQTPVTGITAMEAISTTSTALPRRWLLNTPRGSVRAHTVIHATNGYAAHLLPFLAANRDRQVNIIPTRGQVIATRASAGTDKLLTPSYSTVFEYWFPRPVNGTAGEYTTPLVILGGGRETGGPSYEMGVTDDSVINPAISKTLREFLPVVYPDGWFEQGKAPEMEWTGIMGYTQSGDPLVGPVLDPVDSVDFEGQYIAAGYSGHGMPRAFGCAEALVQIIISDLKNETWKIPDWFPYHFLTTSNPGNITNYWHEARLFV
ncbi:FAD dependent oxidoreductase-domain-containing protein [Gautieria morchelliformis]|nr:FAD dependent oxidoreductase-domain-containing protein [Gautieria morchelliformis]